MKKIFLIVMLSFSLLCSVGCAAVDSDSITAPSLQPPIEGRTDQPEMETPSSAPSSDVLEPHPPSPNYTDFFSEECVHEIYVDIAPEDWRAIKDDPEGKEYYTADISIDGTAIEGVGIRTRGNSSLRAANRFQSERYPLRIKFDEYVDDQTFWGLDELVLNNSNDDPSFLREYLGYEAFRQLGIDAPYVSFFDLYINGKLHGMYVGVEAIDNSYLERVFGNHRGNLYKAKEGASLEVSMDLELLEQKKGSNKSKNDITALI